MNKIFMFFTSMLIVTALYAQKNDTLSGVSHENTPGIHIGKLITRPQFAVNGKLVGRRNMCLNPDDIAAIENIENNQDSVALHKYGVSNVDVIEITMKPDAKLLSLAELLNQYNIPVNERQLPVLLNGIPIGDTAAFIASGNYVQSVAVDSVGKNIQIESVGKNKVISGKDIQSIPAGNMQHLLNGRLCVVSRQRLLLYVKK